MDSLIQLLSYYRDELRKIDKEISVIEANLEDTENKREINSLKKQLERMQKQRAELQAELNRTERDIRKGIMSRGGNASLNFFSPSKSHHSTSVEDNRTDYERFYHIISQIKARKITVNGKEIKENIEKKENRWIASAKALPAIIAKEDENHSKVVEILTQLTKMKEATAQIQKMGEIYSLLNLFDSHGMAAFFTLPTNHRDAEFNAEPDAVHRDKPIFLEFKGLDANEFAGLRQAMERIAVVASRFSLLSTAVAFGCGVQSKEWWKVEYKSSLDQPGFEIHIERLSIDRAAQDILYHCLTTSLTDYYFPHSFAVISGLTGLGILWNRVRIERAGVSTSTVYKITEAEQSICVKVNPHVDRFARESRALRQIGREGYTLAIGTRADITLSSDVAQSRLATFPQIVDLQERRSKTRQQQQQQTPPATDNSPVNRQDEDHSGGLKMESVVACLEEMVTYNSPENPCWCLEYYLTPALSDCITNTTSQFGIIVMETALSLSDESVSKDPAQIYRDLVDCLREIHAKQVYHCDIRSNNIMYFPTRNQFRLVDYDLAMVDEKETTGGEEDKMILEIPPNCGQYRAAPYYLRTVKNDDAQPITIRWTAMDDYCMLFEWFLKTFYFQEIKPTR